METTKVCTTVNSRHHRLASEVSTSPMHQRCRCRIRISSTTRKISLPYSKCSSQGQFSPPVSACFVQDPVEGKISAGTCLHQGKFWMISIFKIQGDLQRRGIVTFGLVLEQQTFKNRGQPSPFPRKRSVNPSPIRKIHPSI